MNDMALYTSTFPLLTTTFIQREIRTFALAGCNPPLIANHRPLPGNYHECDTDLLVKTHYLDDIGPLAVLIEHIRLLLRFPLRWCRTFALSLQSAPTVRMRFDAMKKLWAAGALSILCRRNRIRHLHVHFALGAATIALFWSKITGTTYSISIHGSDVLLPRPMTRENIEGAKYIISNCRFHLDNLPERFCGLAIRRCHIVRIGLDVNRAPWTAAPQHAEKTTLRIFAVGRLIEVKAFRILIDACRIALGAGINLECRIAGSGPLHPELDNQIEAMKLRNGIMLIGVLDEFRVASEMERAHIVCCTSLSEGTPMCLIEAMAKARAVIAPRITAIPEVVEENVTGFLFKKGSPEGCAAAFMRLAEMPLSEVHAMGHRGRMKAEREFDLSVNSRLLIDIHTRERQRR